MIHACLAMKMFILSNSEVCQELYSEDWSFNFLRLEVFPSIIHLCEFKLEEWKLVFRFIKIETSLFPESQSPRAERGQEDGVPLATV